MGNLFDQIADEEEAVSHDIQLLEDKLPTYEQIP